MNTTIRSTPPPPFQRCSGLSANITEVLARIEAATGRPPTRSGSGWVARCPAHDDRAPSLSISERGGRVLVNCHAGCRFADILAGAGIGMAEWMGLDGRESWSRPRVRVVTLRAKPAVDPRLPEVADRWHTRGRHRLRHLAADLCVAEATLAALRVGWAPAGELSLFQPARSDAWAFPMKSAAGEVVGIRLRLPDGGKLAVRGSREGLFLPAGPSTTGGTLYLPEGASDAAALLTLGLPAVGRPSATGGRRECVALVREVRPSEVVVFADPDRAGEDGAEGLAFELLPVCPVRVARPPSGIKDVRAWLNAGANRQDVLRLVEAAPLRRLSLRAGEGGASW